MDASASTNDLYLKALNGAITITGAVGSGTAPNQLFVDGAGSFTASSTITVGSLGVGLLNSFATSVSFADAVKVTGADYNFTADGTTPNFAFALDVNTTGSGTIGFSKTIEASNSNGTIGLASQNGNISVTGTITGKDGVVVSSSGSGLVTLSDNITTDQTDGDVIITSTTGGITTKGVSTSGATADIEIDTDTSGNITIGGNVSASGGGDILLGADTGTFTATGTGNLTINGTVSTTSGDIYIGSGGTGTVSVNKGITTTSAAGDVKIIAVGTQTNAINFAKDATITSAGGVAFTTTGTSNTISFVSGANITSAGNVTVLEQVTSTWPTTSPPQPVTLLLITIPSL
ncbi:hypothetical protein EBX93_07890 [bacterium]|nr:hypothetical protein [bacterium]